MNKSKLEMARNMVIALERRLSDAREAIHNSEPPPALVSNRERVIMTKECYNKIVNAINIEVNS